MTKLQRYQHLEALGMQVWIPKDKYLEFQVKPKDKAVNSKKPTTNLKNDTDMSTKLVDSVKPQQIYSNLNINEQPVNHRQSLKPTSTPDNEKQDTALNKTSNPTEEGSIEPFRLATISINDDCLAVSELPHVVVDKFTRSHEYLIINIMHALNITIDNQLEPAFFDWPIIDLPTIRNNYLSAHEAVTGYLTNQFGLKRRKLLFLFGPNCANLIKGPDSDFEQLRGISQIENQLTIVTHSIDALLRVDSLKIEAWNDVSQLYNTQRET